MEISNVLIFPCGTEIGLELHAALKYEKSVKLFGASSTRDHGCMVFKEYASLPFVTDPAFNDAFASLLKKYNIDYVIPAHDTALLYLVENREKYPTKILAPPAETCRICRSKKATYAALEGYSFIPNTYKTIDDVIHYPVFLKPEASQGSEGIFLAEDKAGAQAQLAADPRLIICEYLPGTEYTIDCYTNQKGELLFSAPRTRTRTKTGISVHSETVDLGTEIQKIAQVISTTLQMTGAWFFQLKEAANGTFKLLEVAPRIAGTVATHRVTGSNFILMSLYEARGSEVAVLRNAATTTIDRAFISRYEIDQPYNSLFLDLDDTLIVHDKVNLNALKWLYQCAQNSIPVHLITRHFQEPRLTLDKFSIHENLFESIIWIEDSTPKSSFMKGADLPLFIDDSFKERQDALENDIPSYTPDAIEAFLDWRL